MRRERTTTERRRALTMLRAGVRLPEVEAATGIPRRTISRWAEWGGVTLPARAATSGGTRYSADERRRALAMLLGGAQIGAVVAATGIHDNTIRAWARRAGVPIPTTRRPRAPVVTPPHVEPRVIPFAGCDHYRVGHRTLCTACRCAMDRGEAVFG